MPSSRTGHFVQIWRPDRKPEESPFALPYAEYAKQFVHVLGRTVSKFRRGNQYYSAETIEEGWQTVSRELPRNKARKIASAYKKAGFPSRVKFIGSPKSKVTDTFGEVKG